MQGFKTVKEIFQECGGIKGLVQSAIEHKAHVEKILAREPGPVRPGSTWIMDSDGYIHPRSPKHKHYEIPPTSFNTPERAKEFARHLSTKIWVEEQSLIDFLNLAATIQKPVKTQRNQKLVKV